MQIFKITELTETQSGQTYTKTEVFSSMEGAQKYFTKREEEIPKEWFPEIDDMDRYEYDNSVVFCWYDNYVTLYRVEEDVLNN